MDTFKYKSELRFFCKARLEIDKGFVDENGTMVVHSVPVNHFQYVLLVIDGHFSVQIRA